VKRLLAWLIDRMGLGTLLSLVLLLVVLGSVALGLADAVRGLDTGLLLTMAGLGLLIGWALARSPLPGWLGGIVAVGLGTEAVILRVGRLGGTLLSLLRTLSHLAWELWWPGPRGDLSWPAGWEAGSGWPLHDVPDGGPVLLALTELWSGVSTLLVRLYHWSLALASGAAAFDPVAVALVWSLTLWVIAVWAGWWVRRCDRPLQGVAPAGALLGVSLFYVRGDPIPLLLLLGATLLLMTLISHNARQRHWGTAGIDFPGDLGQDLAMVTVSLSLALVALAALAPSITVQQIAEWAGRLIQEQASEAKPVADSLGLKPRSRPATFFDQDQVRAPGLPRRHLIGSGPDLSEQIVMIIYPEGHKRAGETQSTSLDAPPQRYYWRGLTYDRYTGRGWLTEGTETVEYEAGQPADFGEFPGPAATDNRAVSVASPAHRVMRQEVRVTRDWGGLLYVAGALVTVDRDFSVAWRAPGDVFGAAIKGRVDSPAVYRADSLVPLVSQAQLRSAGSDYPDWVRNRYLALPEEVPARVFSLARDLTATAPTPYDRALAIEAYLRTFPYNLDLPAPPRDRDVVDYFLFDLQQGYCDYYATSMAVLARAAGLPARLVMGYASGTYDGANGRYIVTEADAHSWVEIYFPGYGWVEFEPTAGRSLIERPADAASLEQPELDTLEPMATERVKGSWLWWLGLPAGVFIFLGLMAIAWPIADSWRLRRLRPTIVVAMLYQRLYRHGRRLGVPTWSGDTPYEFAASLAGRVSDLAKDRRWGGTLIPAVREVRWLTDLYVRTCYSPHHPDIADQVQAIKTWQCLHRRLWLARVWRLSEKN
jgi:transglutaminase-like putative cysteine protease